MTDIEGILWEMFDEERGQFGASGSPARIAEVLTEKLASDESVERAARALYETDRAEYDGDKPWPPRPHFIEDMYRERARAALAAAIGDDDE